MSGWVEQFGNVGDWRKDGTHRYALCPVETVSAYVGRGHDDATRERAVRVGIAALRIFDWGATRPELDRHRPLFERWLKAEPGPERDRIAAEARATGLPSACPSAELCAAFTHAEPGRAAGAAVAHALRRLQAKPEYAIPALERALKAEGFKDLECVA